MSAACRTIVLVLAGCTQQTNDSSIAIGVWVFTSFSPSTHAVWRTTQRLCRPAYSGHMIQSRAARLL